MTWYTWCNISLFYMSVWERTYEHLWTERSAFQKSWYVIVTFKADIRLFVRQLAAHKGLPVGRRGNIRCASWRCGEQPSPKPAKHLFISSEKSLQCQSRCFFLSMGFWLVTRYEDGLKVIQVGARDGCKNPFNPAVLRGEFKRLPFFFSPSSFFLFPHLTRSIRWHRFKYFILSVEDLVVFC